MGPYGQLPYRLLNLGYFLLDFELDTEIAIVEWTSNFRKRGLSETQCPHT
jgi:hypothetical protein